jgi:hypothetical protein
MPLYAGKLVSRLVPQPETRNLKRETDLALVDAAHQVRKLIEVQ